MYYYNISNDKMVSLYIIFLVLYQNFNLIYADTIPVIKVRVDGDVCTNEPNPAVIYKRSFNMTVHVDGTYNIKKASCAYADNNHNIIADTKRITRSGETYVISFGEVNYTVNKWKCILTTSFNKEITCKLNVRVKKKVMLEINGQEISFPINNDLTSDWDTVGTYDYTPGEILNIRQNSFIFANISIEENGKKVFSTNEIGNVRLTLNTKYYTGLMYLYMILSKEDSKASLKLELIPKREVYDTILSVEYDDTPFIPYKRTANKIYYKYTYIFEDSLIVTCKKTKASKGIINIQHETSVGGRSGENEVNTTVNLTSIVQTLNCYIFNENNEIVEEHEMKFVPRNKTTADDMYIKGLRASQIKYRLKREVMYEFHRDEHLTAEFIIRVHNDNYLKCDFQGNSGKGILDLVLTEKEDNTSKQCWTENGAAKSNILILKLVMSGDNEVPKKTTLQELFQDKEGGPDYNWLYVIVAPIVVFIIVLSAACYALKSFRNKKAKEQIEVSYDNLSEGGTQFPPNWDRLNQTAEPKVNSEYSVPFNDQADYTYVSPICNRDDVTYAELTISPRMQETYAEVIPKALRGKDNARTNENYENVFKGEPYLNCDATDYVEVAYCDISALK